jgi:hypothetical protein
MTLPRVPARSSIADPELARSTILDAFDETAMTEPDRTFAGLLRSLVAAPDSAPTAESPARIITRLLLRRSDQG